MSANTSSTHKLALEFGLNYDDESDIASHQSIGFNVVPLTDVTISADYYKNHNIDNKDICFFFEDELQEKKELVNSIIRYKTYTISNKIFARNCTVRTIDAVAANDFLSKNHLSGGTTSSLALGLFKEETLVSCLTFRKPFNVKYRGFIEIARFASLLNYSVVGGLSKLFKHSRNLLIKLGYDRVLTYSDLRLGKGSSYLNLGFSLIGKTKSNYFYTDGTERLNRLRFRAQDGISEREIAKEAGVHRVYGLGSNIYTQDLVTFKSGVYRILNTETGDFYIGSSIHYDKRELEHFSLARNGKHHSIVFQRAWDKYGKNAFKFEILEECTTDQLIFREQYYLDRFHPKYNVSTSAGTPPPPINKPIVRTCIKTGDTKIYRTRHDAKIDGFNEGSILSCCAGRANTHKGYYWKFQDGSSPKFVEVGKARPVKRLGPDGVEKYYKSITAAAKDGFTVGGISACCLGKLKTHRGYFWCFEENTYPENKTEPKLLVNTSLSTPNKASLIDRIDLKTKEIISYPSMSSAVKDGFNQGHISECCLGKRNMHKGYIWRYHSDISIDFGSIEIKEFDKKIIRIDSGGLTKIYPNLNSVKLDGFSGGNVYSCCNGQRGSHAGYTWQYLDSKKGFKSTYKEVVQIDPKTNLEIKKYKTAAATKQDGFTPSKVGACCLGRRKSHKGYLWRHA